jgi:hypothetical protein
VSWVRGGWSPQQSNTIAGAVRLVVWVRTGLLPWYSWTANMLEQLYCCLVSCVSVRDGWCCSLEGSHAGAGGGPVCTAGGGPGSTGVWERGELRGHGAGHWAAGDSSTNSSVPAFTVTVAFRVTAICPSATWPCHHLHF